MTSDEYTQLMDFLANRFARMDARFDAVETRLRRVEVMQEAMGDQIRVLAEGLATLNARADRIEARLDAHDRRFDRLEAELTAINVRLDRIESRVEDHDRRFDRLEAELAVINVRLDDHDRRFDHVDRGIGGLHVRFDRFAVDFGTVRLGHEARIEALERLGEGGGRGPARGG